MSALPVHVQTARDGEGRPCSQVVFEDARGAGVVLRRWALDEADPRSPRQQGYDAAKAAHAWAARYNAGGRERERMLREAGL